VGGELGVSVEKILDLPNYAASPLYTDSEKIALEYADRMTISDNDVTDEFFERLKQYFSEDEIVELTAGIAWENCSTKFNRALRIQSQNLWKSGG